MNKDGMTDLMFCFIFRQRKPIQSCFGTLSLSLTDWFWLGRVA